MAVIRHLSETAQRSILNVPFASAQALLAKSKCVPASARTRQPPMKSTLVFALTVLLVGCAPSPAPPSNDSEPAPVTSESHSVDRSWIKVGAFMISTVFDVPASSTIQEAAASLAFGDHTVAADFNQHELTIDEETMIPLAADVNEINVKFVRGTLLVTVDEVLVFPQNR